LFAKTAKRHLSLKILIYCYGVSSEKDEEEHKWAEKGYYQP